MIYANLSYVDRYLSSRLMYGVMIGYAFASLGKATRLPYENVGGIAVCLICVGTELYKALFRFITPSFL